MATRGVPTGSVGTSAGPIALCGLDHVVLRIRDLPASLHFYCEGLGCRIERRLDELGLVQLRAGSHLIDLVPIDSPLGQAGGKEPAREAPNLDHFALQLESFDEAAIRAHLAERGIATDGVGEAADRYGAQGTGPSLYLRDPDGNTVELKGPAHTGPIGSDTPTG